MLDQVPELKGGQQGVSVFDKGMDKYLVEDKDKKKALLSRKKDSKSGNPSLPLRFRHSIWVGRGKRFYLRSYVFGGIARWEMSSLFGNTQ